jgi:DNA repair ATPase RecN
MCRGDIEWLTKESDVRRGIKRSREEFEVELDDELDVLETIGDELPEELGEGAPRGQILLFLAREYRREMESAAERGRELEEQLESLLEEGDDRRERRRVWWEARIEGRAARRARRDYGF